MAQSHSRRELSSTLRGTDASSSVLSDPKCAPVDGRTQASLVDTP